MQETPCRPIPTVFPFEHPSCGIDHAGARQTYWAISRTTQFQKVVIQITIGSNLSKIEPYGPTIIVLNGHVNMQTNNEK